ncbi:MAG: hypothetical protein K5770_07975 [Lachnospiraceae bacterium]|nr:hypothetical protein [Lachnospiraceae bacterium]
MDIAKDIVITADNLASIKFWIMQEMQKLETERDEFETEQIEFEIEKDEFKAEKKKYEEERRKASELLRKREESADLERKSLNYQKNLMERKLAILENGFDELNRDKQMLEREKEEFNALKASLYAADHGSKYEDTGILFHGVDNILALKKRYRDLLKIFHPDNFDGDNEAVQIINEEYAMLKDYF